MRSGDDSRALARRLAAFGDAVDLSQGRLRPADVEAARRVAERAGERWRLAPEATVVALAGSTGSGKSSLLNAVAGANVAPVGVRRPTTSAALALVDAPSESEQDEVAALLDWLQVEARVEATAHTASGLVVLDLPDTDSVRQAHRLQVDRLVTQVDLLVWVVDPQKYADAVLHERYLRRLSHHAEVTLVVLNQVDTLSEPGRDACLADLRRLLAEDGLGDVTVLCTSAATGEGVEELRGRLRTAADSHHVAAIRLGADVDAAARQLQAVAMTPAFAADAGEGKRARGATHVARRRRRDLVSAMERAAGVPVVVDAVERAVVHRAVARVGWPPARWVRRLRPDPLRRLRVEPAHDGASLGRTSLPAPTAAARAEVDNAVRALVDDTGRALPQPWVDAVRSDLDADAAARAAALDEAVASTDLGAARPVAASRVLGILQWLVTLAALVGAVWLLALAVAAWLRLPLLDPPTVDLSPGSGVAAVALPTLLLLAGVVAGLLLAAIGRALARLAARRRGRRARRRLSEAVADVARQHVLGPLDDELARHARLQDRLAQSQSVSRT